MTMMIMMRVGATQKHIDAVRARIPPQFRHRQYDGGTKVIVYIEDYNTQEAPDHKLFKGMDMVENVSAIRVSLPDRLLQSIRVS